MKHKSLYTIIAALIAFTGNAWADTDKLPAADGWTKITTVPTASDISSNYYVFVDDTNDLMLGVAKGNHQATKWYSLGLYYQTSVEPTSASINGKTWILETQGDGFALRNLEYSALCFQTESAGEWMYDTNDVPTTNAWTQINLIYANGSWTLQNGKHGGDNYIGPWDGGNFKNGAECAANKSATGEIGHFQIYAISRAQFKQNLLDNASASNPVDVTPWYVTNATFDLGNRDGWTEEGSGGNNNTSYGGGCEIWHRTAFNIHQDLTVPNGKYKVSLQMAGTSGAGKVYGTSNGTTKEAASSAAAGSDFQNTILSMIQDRTFGQTTTDEITVSNGSLTIGMKCETTDQWINFDNFKLYCTGLDLSAYQAQLAELVGDCNDFIASHVVPTACETAISSAITTYNKSYETAKEYSTAIVALTAVLETYSNNTELQSAYAAYKTMRTNVQGLENTDTYKYTDPGSAKSTFDAAVSSANTAVEAATTVAAINTQTANLRAAALTFISSVTAEDGNPFNLTFLASTAAADWQTTSGAGNASTAPAWSVPKPDASMADFIECYTEASGGESITGNILYQTLSGMPAGYYTVALYAAASYTPNRGSLQEKCSDGQPNITFGFAGESTLSLPVVHRTSLTASDQVPVNLSVQMASSGDLTFGIKKTAAGSNWHVAQIYTITYSKDPDLTILKGDRDALVSEAQGLLASDDANLLTEAQQNALSTAISNAQAANTFDDLNTVTLTTLPNAIQTALQQIQTVKDNRVLMLAALERFENNYNLVDGTDYSRVTMSAAAWATLIAKVNAVTTALDDVSQAANYGTIKDALIAQMDATDASLRLFKNYKAMADGTVSVLGGSAAEIAPTSDTDTDATETAAIARLNTTFVNYALGGFTDIDMGAFLGENLDFSAAQGSALNTTNDNGIYSITGWEVEYADADTWAVLQNQNSDHQGQLYMRKNWGSSLTTLMVMKQKMLPVGKYALSFSWNSNMENMTNLSQYKLGETVTPIGEATTEAQKLTYEFEVTDAPKTFDLTFGFQKQNSENTPAQLIVDNVTLTYNLPDELKGSPDEYTTYLTPTRGFTEVTSLDDIIDDPSQCYILTAAENTNLFVGIGRYKEKPSWAGEDTKALRYRQAGDPVTDLSNFFTIEKENGYIGLRNVVHYTSLFQTHDNAGFMYVLTYTEPTMSDWCYLKPTWHPSTLNSQPSTQDGYWMFENGKYPASSDAWARGYMGPWNNSVETDEPIALNRLNTSGDEAGHYRLFRISRSDLLSLQQTINSNRPADVTWHITNPSFETGDETGWTLNNKDPEGNDEFKARDYTMTNKDGQYLMNAFQWWASSLSVSQTIENLPAGQYTLSGVVASWEGRTVTLSANASMTTATGVTADTGIPVSTSVTIGLDGKLTINVGSTTDWWTEGVDHPESDAQCFFKLDDVRLSCTSLALDATAVRLPNNATTVLVPGQWYYYETSYSTEFQLIGPVDDIVYTTNGSVSCGSAAGTTAASTLTLPVGRTYFKTSANNATLQIAPKNAVLQGTFTAVALNVDGLPNKINYGVGSYDLNPDGPGAEGTLKISQYLASKNYDFIGCSEDFNYNGSLMESLNANYFCGTIRNTLSISGISYLDLIQGKIHVETDGLNLIWKFSKISVTNESWTRWWDTESTDGNQYVEKGYRHYDVQIDGGPVIDVFILHMDAGDTNATWSRESQWRQLAAAINNSDHARAKLIIGDTNSRYTRENVTANFFSLLSSDFTASDVWVEKYRNGIYPTTDMANLTDQSDPDNYSNYEIVDKIIYINPTAANTVRLTPQTFSIQHDYTYGYVEGTDNTTPLGDHHPVVVQFQYQLVGDVAPTPITFADASDNTAHIGYANNVLANVTLSGRTLYKDGSWNTLCLPFNLALEGLPLESAPLNGAKVMELDTEGWYDGNTRYEAEANGRHRTGLADDGTLYLYFKDATTIHAGVPYLIKWDSGSDLVNPVFNSVTVSKAAATGVTSKDGTVTFQATYDPVALAKNDQTNLFLGDGNTLYYPGEDNFYVNAFRAYFQLSPAAVSGARQFVLSFGDETVNVIPNLNLNDNRNANPHWHTLQGVKVTHPTRPGLYISNGKLIMIK